MCGCLDKELTEFPLIKSRIYLCIMTTNARTRVAPKIILSFLYIPGLYYIISMGLIWTEREAQWEREKERKHIWDTHKHTHNMRLNALYIPVLRYMFSPTLPNSLLLLPGLWPLRQVLAHFCATLASSELHFCITDTKKFTLTKYHKKCKPKKSPEQNFSGVPIFESQRFPNTLLSWHPRNPRVFLCWEQYNGEITRGFRRCSPRQWFLICYNLFVPWILRVILVKKRIFFIVYNVLVRRF